MTTAVGARPGASATGEADRGQQVADVFVIFGITGDLAKVMTFHSLYRLEQRGLLSCPIVGVAVSDWSMDDLRSHARAAIEGSGEQIDDSVFDRLIGRMSYVSGDFGDAATYERVARAVGDAKCPGVLSRDPAVPVRPGDQGSDRRRPDQDRTSRRREAVRPRSRVRARARRGDPPIHRRVAAVPDRPFPREDGPRRVPVPPLRELQLRADLEPQPHRGGRDHDGGELRGRGPRPFLRSRRRAARRGRQPPDAVARGRRDGGTRR